MLEARASSTGLAVNAHQIALLRKTIDRLAGQYPMRTAQLGVAIMDGSDGRLLIDYQADHEFAPASNFKLLDAATALAYLGPGFRYHTRLLARGTVSGNALAGDLILVGGGDPVLSRGDLRNAVSALAARGIKRITGSVVVDGSIFDGQRFGSGWAWDDMPYYYQPPIEALSLDEGTVEVTASPGSQAGAPLRVWLQRDPGSMTVVSAGTTTAPRGLNDYDCFRSLGSTQIAVVGHMPLGEQPQTFHCTVEDSNLDSGAVFVQMLADAGIAVSTPALRAAPGNIALDVADSGPAPPPAALRYPGAQVVWDHASPDVAELLRRMMPPSDNFIAEHLFKMLPVAALGRRGSFAGGAQVEQRFIASLALPPLTIDNGDGSGLSQGDRITPRAIAEVLRWETRNPAGVVFMHALAKAGINGTVRKHLRGTDAVGRVLAKDGYIWHVSTFSGYAYTKHHGLMIFSVMFNDANGMLGPFLRAEDKIVQTLVDLP
ncbi:MAG: D-alanyl-D-alanine carboxypeptidase/D-alanyl-D-alanine-endopeptidase [Candidatus Eremiobacteraeota bacterium]|nr:D-alanyl-D-alanine carboxypeptidase/D-alanyl-D-alanine-endopeptidase [Candidatus Eremiobacteraeota bacterium]